MPPCAHAIDDTARPFGSYRRKDGTRVRRLRCPECGRTWAEIAGTPGYDTAAAGYAARKGEEIDSEARDFARALLERFTQVGLEPALRQLRREYAFTPSKATRLLEKARLWAAGGGGAPSSASDVLLLVRCIDIHKGLTPVPRPWRWRWGPSSWELSEEETRVFWLLLGEARMMAFLVSGRSIPWWLVRLTPMHASQPRLLRLADDWRQEVSDLIDAAAGDLLPDFPPGYISGDHDLDRWRTEVHDALLDHVLTGNPETLPPFIRWMIADNPRTAWELKDFARWLSEEVRTLVGSLDLDPLADEDKRREQPLRYFLLLREGEMRIQVATRRRVIGEAAASVARMDRSLTFVELELYPSRLYTVRYGESVASIPVGIRSKKHIELAPWTATQEWNHVAQQLSLPISTSSG